MAEVLFVIPNLGHGGAEKVLINLINHLDPASYRVTVMTLYDEGVNKAGLAPHIQYKACFKRSFPGVSHVLKLFSPKQLYQRLIPDHYDIVVSYLEGQTARIVSGCTDQTAKKVCWIHRTMTSIKDSSRLFRSSAEAKKCYAAFDCIVSVSEDVQKAFMNLFHLDEKGTVLYNTNESKKIIDQSKEAVSADIFPQSGLKICAMGSLIPVKGFDRLINVHYRLVKEGHSLSTYILGEGPDKAKLEEKIEAYSLRDSVFLLGYQTNPYKYLARCDLFVCSSWSEGFSTAVTESMILGVPVTATRVSGMRELLGQNEYGIIAENSEEGLYCAIKQMLTSPELLQKYKSAAQKRGETFSTEKTVLAVEEMFRRILEPGKVN